MNAREITAMELGFIAEAESINLKIEALKNQDTKKNELIDLHQQRINIYELLHLKNQDSDTLKAILFNEHFKIVQLTDPKASNYQAQLDAAIQYLEKIKNKRDSHFRTLSTLTQIKAKTIETSEEEKASILGRSTFLRSLIKEKNCDDHLAIYNNILKVLPALLSLKRYKAGIYACNQAIDALAKLADAPSTKRMKLRTINKIKARFASQCEKNTKTNSSDLKTQSIFANKRPLEQSNDSHRPYKKKKPSK